MENRGAVLLAEDNADDIFLVGLAFAKLGITIPLQIVSDGRQALQYLKGEGPYDDRDRFPIPHLILLDLDMPVMTGFEVLEWLRREPQLSHIPVIVLTSSVYSPDVRRAYELGANSFLTKPMDLREFTDAVKQMAEFWLGRCQLPGFCPSIPLPANPTTLNGQSPTTPPPEADEYRTTT